MILAQNEHILLKREQMNPGAEMISVLRVERLRSLKTRKRSLIKRPGNREIKILSTSSAPVKSGQLLK